MKRKTILVTLVSALASTLPLLVTAQSEVMAWGNITGLRVDGELMEFETSLRVAWPGWSEIVATGKEKQNYPRYTREGDSQTVTTTIGGVGFTQRVTDIAAGRSEVELTVLAEQATRTAGVWFCIDLPAGRYGAGTVAFERTSLPLSGVDTASPADYPRHRGRTITIDGTGRRLKLEFASPVTAFVSRDTSGGSTLWVSLTPDLLSRGRSYRHSFSIVADGDVDNDPVKVTIDPSRPGRQFDGLGGNFRLQNPANDPKVIDYSLENLRVAWGRVEMPWRTWHPDENSDPLALARAGKADPRVLAAMEMARRLKAMGMPVIVSAWFPPQWAVEGDPASYTPRGGVRAYRLDPAKKEQIYRSLIDYLVYLKEAFGVEAAMYSFNESDLGIDVLHTPGEHAEFIRDMGARLASRGLATKLLLGDNSDATTFDFIVPGMNDPAARPYIGAVSFHSWRGCDDETLRRWGDAARRLNVPLLVGEGSTDAAAWRYPQIFAESTFALYEINLYIRICALAQPLSILQWQLTADYSLLLGDGIFGTDGPLRTTQRFWNLKQLASTPAGSFALPFECSKEQVNCAAFGNIARGEYAVHMVNNGAARRASIEGLPSGAGSAAGAGTGSGTGAGSGTGSTVGSVRVYVTSAGRDMEEIRDVQFTDGTLSFDLPAASLATAIVTM
jgi:hypothetical protein